MCRAGPNDRCCDDSTVCRTSIQPWGERYLAFLACKQGFYGENHGFRRPDDPFESKNRCGNRVRPLHGQSRARVIGAMNLRRHSRLLSRTADGPENHILAIANDLMQERPPDQFAPLVEFEVLAGAREVDRLALANQSERIDSRRYFRSRSVGDRNDLPGELDRICRLGFLDGSGKDVDRVELKCRERKHGTVRRTHRPDKGLVLRAVQRTDRLNVLDPLRNLLADVLDEGATALDPRW